MLLPLFNEAQVLQEKIEKAQEHINDLESITYLKGFAEGHQEIVVWGLTNTADPTRGFMTDVIAAMKLYWETQRDLFQAEFDAL